jgi:DNA-binding response OmpR family regulator
MRIAVLAVDPAQCATLCDALNHAGHRCDAFRNAKELLALPGHADYQLLVIDLPTDIPCTALLPPLRRGAAHATPMLLLATAADEDAVLAAMRDGTVDYLVKPARRSELVLRARILLKQAYPGQHETETILFRQYSFDEHNGRVTVAGQPVVLTRKEFDLSLLFFRNMGRPLSRAYLMEAIWSQDTDLPSRTLDTHVSRVRSKLALSTENGFRLAPVYSYGYRLEQIAD